VFASRGAVRERARWREGERERGGVGRQQEQVSRKSLGRVAATFLSRSCYPASYLVLFHVKRK
jgi:hypothetical protein